MHAVPLPDDFVLTPTVGTRWDARVIEGGVPRVRVALSRRSAGAVDQLLGGTPVGRVEAASSTGLVARRLVELDLAVANPPAHPGPVPEATVVIPAHNAASTLAATLESLGGTTAAIVVDDGSSDGTGRIAREHGARVVRNPRPLGPAGARNVGAELVQTELVAFLDADAVVPRDWLEALVPHLSDPGLGGVAPRVVAAGGSGALTRREAGAGVLDAGRDAGLVHPDGRVPFTSTTALVLRVDHFRNVGCFAASMRFGEDLDLVWRLAKTGRPVRFVPEVVVRHRSRDRLGAHLRNVASYASAAAPLDACHGFPRACHASAAAAAAGASAVLGAPVLATAFLAATVVDEERAGRRVAGAVRLDRAERRRVVARGLVGQLRGVAAAFSRPWLPLAVVAVVVRRRARLGVPLVLVARWLSRARRLGQGPVTAGVAVLEDVAATAGLWGSCVRHGRVGPLCPGGRTAWATRSTILGTECVLP